MNPTIDTTQADVWWHNKLQGVSLACGLALAAVLAFGTPEWRDGSEKPRRPAASASVATPKYPNPGPSVMYIVDSEAEKLALESALGDHSLTGGARASILVAEDLRGRSPNEILAGEVDSSVQIIDLMDDRVGPTQ